MNPEKPKPNESSEIEPSPDIDAFFQRLPGNLHWPPPSAAAIAAAVEAVQRAAPRAAEEIASDDSEIGAIPAAICKGCGEPLAPGIRFCGGCGLSTAEEIHHPADASQASLQIETPQLSMPAHSKVAAPAIQHHYHHHYHHFVGGSTGVPVLGAPDPSTAQGRLTSSAPGSRAELSARQVAQNWAQSCNTRHLDDLVELYTSDATLIRPNVLPIRTAPAIREFLASALEAGLGELEMNSLRTEVFGDIAIDLGRCKMLVPVAMGKRREERGKYLLVLARHGAGHWRIIADCWSTDLNVSGSSPGDSGRKPAGNPAPKKLG